MNGSRKGTNREQAGTNRASGTNRAHVGTNPPQEVRTPSLPHALATPVGHPSASHCAPARPVSLASATPQAQLLTRSTKRTCLVRMTFAREQRTTAVRGLTRVMRRPRVKGPGARDLRGAGPRATADEPGAAAGQTGEGRALGGGFGGRPWHRTRETPQGVASIGGPPRRHSFLPNLSLVTIDRVDWQECRGPDRARLTTAPSAIRRTNQPLHWRGCPPYPPGPRIRPGSCCTWLRRDDAG